MARSPLPVAGVAIIDTENSPTIGFFSWLADVDSAIVDGNLGIGRREPLPPNETMAGRMPSLSFTKWLLWVDRSILSIAITRQALPPAGTAIIGTDLKPTIPFYSWCRYVDKTLP